MTFSWMGGSAASNGAYLNEVKAFNDKQKASATARQSIIEQQQSDALKISDATIVLANKKALDQITRKSTNYSAGVVDPEEANNEAAKKTAELTTGLTNKKALDIATKKSSDYAAGIANPEEVLAKSRKDKADAEGALSDYEQYDRKQALDIKNQDTAWASASKYKQSDAKQQIDNQQYQQRTTINQANKLRSDDNQRAIDGFKMKF